MYPNAAKSTRSGSSPPKKGIPPNSSVNSVSKSCHSCFGVLPSFFTRLLAIIPHIIGNPIQAYILFEKNPNFSSLEILVVVLRAEDNPPYRIGIVAFDNLLSTQDIHLSRLSVSSVSQRELSLYFLSICFIIGVESTIISPPTSVHTGTLPHPFVNFNSFKGINTDNNLELINYSINDNIPDWSEGCFEFTVPDDSITRVSVIYNTKLKSFAPTHMSLGSIDVTNLPELTFLDIPTNNLTSLDLSNNTLLEELRAGNNFLTSIDLSTNSGVLKAIKIGDNNLTELDVTNFPLLEVFSVPGNNLTSIDLSNNPLLREISVKYNTNLEGILDVSFMPNLAGTEDCHNCTGEFYASGTKLDCIQLSEEQLAKYEAGELERWSLGDIPYSLNCN